MINKKQTKKTIEEIITKGREDLDILIHQMYLVERIGSANRFLNKFVKNIRNYYEEKKWKYENTQN